MPFVIQFYFYTCIVDFSLQFTASKFIQAADMAVDDITFPGCALAPIRACISGEYRCTRGSCVKPNQVLYFNLFKVSGGVNVFGFY